MASKVLIDESATEPPPSYSDSVIDDDIKKQVDFIHQHWTQRTDKNKRLVIVTAGKAGAGKSTLINNFLELEGDAVFEARSGPKSVTTRVDHCDKEINGVQVRVIDMPGLHAVDIGVKTDSNEAILGDLKALIGKGADVVFYCIRLMDRLDNVDLQNMDTLTNAFGTSIWERVIFVFTHTDFVLFNGSSPQQLVEEYIENLHQHLVVKSKVNVEIRSMYSFQTEMVSEDAEIFNFNGIVGIPVSKVHSIPPKWRITLLLQVIGKCREENIPAVLKLKFISWNEVKRAIITTAAGGIGGAVVGTVAGATIGAIVGGAITAPIGGAGAVPTAAAGAALGSWIGTLGGTGSVGITALTAQIVYTIRARFKIKKRARLKIKEMLEREKRLAQDAHKA